MTAKICLYISELSPHLNRFGKVHCCTETEILNKWQLLEYFHSKLVQFLTTLN